MAIFHYYDSLTSTMDEARRHALEGAEESTVIVAAVQTGGYGRQGRPWESLRGNLHFTYLTYQDCPLPKTCQLSLVACVAAGEALHSILPPGHSLRYKWPNDLLLNGKKVGGILLEALVTPNTPETAYLIGCGINLVSPPSIARYPATAFQAEGIYVAYEETLQKVGASIQHHLALWKKDGFSPIRTLWVTSAMGLGTHISLDAAGTLYEGLFKGIDEEGALILQTPQGTIKRVTGEVLRNEMMGALPPARKNPRR
jgi:BirA family biotin operon repressor/biotin-[acetyl-CoA-carboxylase] ligase